MTTCLGKNCSFGLPRMPFKNCCQYMYLIVSLFGFEDRMWDLNVSVPDHCLSFYVSNKFSITLTKVLCINSKTADNYLNIQFWRPVISV